MPNRPVIVKVNTIEDFGIDDVGYVRSAQQHTLIVQCPFIESAVIAFPQELVTPRGCCLSVNSRPTGDGVLSNNAPVLGHDDITRATAHKVYTLVGVF